jgi:multiple sugar transport system substrate-binding protein
MNKFIRLFAMMALVALSIASFATARAQQPVQLTLEGWSSTPNENQMLQQIIDTFNKNNPDIQVKLNQVPDYDTTLAKDLASGTPPDAFYVDSFRLLDLVNAGALEPIGDKIEKPDDFYPALKDAFTTGGKFYCPPKDFSTLALFINSDMLAKANLKPPTTWEELEAAAKAMTTSSVAGIAIQNDLARFIAFLYQAGATVTDEGYTKMTINSPEGLAAMQFYTGLYTKGYAKTPQDLGAGWAGEAFGKQQAAMVVEGNWLVPSMKNDFGSVKYQVVELPAGPKGKATMAFTVCYAVPAKGKNIEASTKLVSYLAGAEGMKAWTDLGLAMPTRTSLREGWLQKFPELKPFLDGAEYARKWQFVPGFQAVLDTTNNELLSVFSGNQTPEGALKTIEQVGNEVLAKSKGMTGGSGAATAPATQSP